MGIIHIILIFICVQFVHNFPVPTPEVTTNETTWLLNDTNSPGELLVIREVVYEIGILTDEDNSTEDSEESHEEIDLRIYDSSQNGSGFDFSNLPVPLQTNVSSRIITAITPFNLESLNLSSVSNNSMTVEPSSFVDVLTNLSTTNPEAETQVLDNLGFPQHIFNISKLP